MKKQKVKKRFLRNLTREIYKVNSWILWILSFILLVMYLATIFSPENSILRNEWIWLFGLICIVAVIASNLINLLYLCLGIIRGIRARKKTKREEQWLFQQQKFFVCNTGEVFFNADFIQLPNSPSLKHKIRDAVFAI